MGAILGRRLGPIDLEGIPVVCSDGNKLKLGLILGEEDGSTDVDG